MPLRIIRTGLLICCALFIAGVGLATGYFIWFIGDDNMASWRIARGEGGPPYPTWWQSFHATNGYVWLLLFLPSFGFLYLAAALTRLAYLDFRSDEPSRRRPTSPNRKGAPWNLAGRRVAFNHARTRQLTLLSSGSVADPGALALVRNTSPMKAMIGILYLVSVAFAATATEQLPNEAVAALKTGKKFILFSLEPPSDRKLGAPEPKPEQSHHGFRILGSTELADTEARVSAIAAITDAVRHFDGALAACFEPRHSLRVIAANGTTHDFVACFECHQVYVYRGDNRIGTAGMTGSQKQLDDLLIRAKVPVAKFYSSK